MRHIQSEIGVLRKRKQREGAKSNEIRTKNFQTLMKGIKTEPKRLCGEKYRETILRHI